MDSRPAKTQRILIAVLVFFVVLAIFPLTPKPTIDVKVLGYELFAFVALALWLFTPRHAKQATSRASFLVPLVLAFLATNLAASLFSINTGYSLYREFIKLAALSVLFFAAADVFCKPKHIWGLIGVICIAVSIASLYGLVQFMGMDPFPWEDTGLMSRVMREAPSTFGNPNLASHTLALAIILACGLCTRRRRQWALLCIPLFLCHFALTRTRGSLLALAGAFLLVLVAQLISRTVKKPSHAVAVTFGAIFAAVLIGATAVTAIAKTKAELSHVEGTSLRSRYHSFYGACRMIQDNPWLGHGPGMYRVASPAYWTPLEIEVFRGPHRMNYYVHNEPLEAGVDAGLCAAIVYVCILFSGMYYGLCLGVASNDSERRRLGITLAAFFFAFLLDGLSGFNVHAPVSAVLLFVVAGATAGLWRARESPPTRHPFQNRWPSLSWRVLALGCASILPILAVRNFTAEFYQKRGEAMLHYESYAQAGDCFEKAASLAPYNWLHPYYLGLTALRTENHGEAAKHFARTLELNHNYLDALFRISGSLINMAASSEGAESESILKQATQYAQRILQLSPLFPDGHDALGRIAFLRATRLPGSSAGETSETAAKMWLQAEDHFLRAIENDSEREDQIYRLIATTRFAREDVPAAQKALIHSLKAKPDEMETWGLLLQSCQRTGQYDPIRTSLDWGIELLDESASAPDELGALRLLRARVLYDGYGDEPGAEDAFVHAAQSNPARVDGWAAFHAFVKSAGREQAFTQTFLQAAAAWKDAAQDLPPVVQAVALGLGQDENSIGVGTAKLVEALEQPQATPVNADGTADAFSWAADVLTARAQQASLSAKESSHVLFGLGLVHGACGNFDESARLLEQALPGLSGEQRTLGLVQLGAALTETGKTEQAVRTFEQAAEQAPANFEAHYGLARALARDGQSARARQEYLAVLTNFELNKEGRRTIRQELEALPD